MRGRSQESGVRRWRRCVREKAELASDSNLLEYQADLKMYRPMLKRILTNSLGLVVVEIEKGVEVTEITCICSLKLEIYIDENL
ncbi:MAG: hypothetical protein QNJ74_18820 [Trichodesmium sp. MO_231.B1]|nr:hypothetical protein [Trichodesmium sp. MO_231.B1]